MSIKKYVGLLPRLVKNVVCYSTASSAKKGKITILLTKKLFNGYAAV